MASDVPTTPGPLDYERPRRTSQPPPGLATFGMWLFLTSLFILFTAAMVAYVVIREAGHRSPPAGALHLPQILWFSTAMVIGVSISLSRALHFIRRERQGQFRSWLGISLALALGFLLVQAPAMAILLIEHGRLRAAGMFLYGLVFILVLLHALHVVGGMVVLIRVTWRSRRGVYDHEHFQPVRYTAMYWHFLDIIWVLMFTTFLLTA
jgi:heme/copper-type cytochrome/quinol oxidase subunit 3